MHFTVLDIDGFGIFREVSLTELPPGLVLISGRNEAGKSTLLGFIRNILFGFPRAGAREAAYPPLAGGSHGGRISLLTRDGASYLVERRPGKGGGTVTVRGPDGRSGGAEMLQQLLGGMTREVFSHLYAFSLGELQSIETLQEESVKGIIYGASAGMGMHALPSALKTIDERMAALFKPGGSKPSINLKLREIEDLRARLREAAREVGGYDAACDELRQGQERLRSLQAEADRTSGERRRLDLCARLWPSWLDLREGERALRALPEQIERFPAEGMARLDRELALLGEHEERAAERRERLRRLREAAAAIVVDAPLLARAGDVEQLSRDLGDFLRQGRELPLKEQEEARLGGEIRLLLGGLGPEWSEERVLELDRSVSTREALRRHQERLRMLEDSRRDALTILAAKETEAARADAEAREAETAAAGLGAADEVVAEEIALPLRHGRSEIAGIQRDLPLRGIELRHEREQLDRLIREIDPGWTVAELSRFDGSIAARKRVDDHQALLREAAEELREAALRRRTQEAELHRLREQHRAAAARLAAASPPPVGSAEQAHPRERSALMPAAGRSWLSWAGIAAALAGAGAATFFAFLGKPMAAAGAGGLFILAALLLLLLGSGAAGVRGPAGGGEEEDALARLRAALEEEVRLLAQGVEPVERECREAREREESTAGLLAARRESWQEELAASRLHGELTPELVAVIFSRVDTALQRLENLRRIESRIAEMEAALTRYRELAEQIPSVAEGLRRGAELLAECDRFFERQEQARARGEERRRLRRTLEERTALAAQRRQELDEAGRAAARATGELAAAQALWRGWLEERRLAGDLSPETAIEAFDRAEHAAATVLLRRGLATGIAGLRSELETYRSRVAELIAGLGRPVPEPGQIPRAVEALAEALQAAGKNREEAAHLARQIAEDTAEVEGLLRHGERARAAIAALLREAGAAEEEAFRRRGALFAERSRLLAAVAGAERSLRQVSGEEDMAVLRAILAPLTLEEIRLRDAGLEAEERGIATELEALRQRCAELRHSVERLASADELARLRAEEERLRTEIRQEGLAWATHAAARSLIARAREAFERDQQPRVIQEAAVFFRAMSGGRYTGLFAPLGEETIAVETAERQRRRPEELSRGTAEQLYLALRFGYIRAHAERNDPLPVVMDDVLVNFDPERARAAAGAILELSREQQVLFFTCHPETVELFRRLDPGLRPYRLAGGRFEL